VKNVAAGFEAKPPETVIVVFEAKPLETVATSFEAKPAKTVRVVLRPNHSQTVTIGFEAQTDEKSSDHSQTVDLGFKAQPKNPRSSSPRARCRPHTVPPDLSTAQPPSTRPVRPSPVLCIRSPTSAMILVDAHHAAPATCTPRDKQTRFSKRNKGKRKTKQSRIRIQISPSQ
jgi:hypothetical protein